MKLYIHVQHGLCNRLRAIMSGLLLSKISKRELVLIWEKDCHCDCYFYDLFENSGFKVFDSIKEINFENVFVYNYMENEENPAKTKRINYYIQKDIYIKTAYVLEHFQLSWENENIMFNKLLIKSDVLEKIKEYERKFEINKCIGFHIRSQIPSNNNKFDNSNNWNKDSHEKIIYWRNISSLNKFVQLIDRLYKRNSNLNFFISTDEENNIKILKEKFGNRILVVERNVFDRSKEQIQYALIDLYLLSKCKDIFGSYWSSFSEVAHRISGKQEINYSGVNF